jgi:hypothetical protein
LHEEFDRLLVVDDCKRVSPVRTPQAAVEAPGVVNRLAEGGP